MTGSAPWLTPPADAPGSYCWYYADFSGPGVTAVAILLLGGPFSPGRRPCAVNFAVYPTEPTSRFRPTWVLSEYDRASWSASALTIGTSSLESLPDGRLRVSMRERTAPWGRERVEATLELIPEVPPGPLVTLVDGLPHEWQPIAARAHATLSLGGDSPITVEGTGYLDSNRGEEPLGLRLHRWRWTRVHSEAATSIAFTFGDAPSLEVIAGPSGVEHRHTAIEPWANAGDGLTGWALRIPRALGTNGLGLTAPRLLESSPFYARLLAEGPGVYALSEVADFARFRSPAFRWMTHFRSRLGTETAP